MSPRSFGRGEPIAEMPTPQKPRDRRLSGNILPSRPGALPPNENLFRGDIRGY